MKKRIIVLIATLMMAMLLIVGCNKKEEAKDTTDGKATESEVKVENGYQYISAEDSVKIAEKGEDHIIDVREWDNYVEGRLVNSVWAPIFPLEDESLEKDMAEFGKSNLNDGKKIYLVCNSGKRGAEKTTDILKEVGIDSSLIFTVEGGAKSLEKEKALNTIRLEDKIDYKYISGEDFLKEKDAQVIDIRDDENYDKGHLENSIHQDLTDFDDAKLQTEMFKLASEKIDKEKPVYFLCYSGNKCAKTAISIFRDAHFNTDNLFIIEDGAKDSAIQDSFVK